MSDIEPRNGVLYRLDRLEKEVDRLKDGKPDVVAAQVSNLAHDVRELGIEMRRIEKKFDDGMASIQRRVMAAFVTIATGLAIALVVQNQGAL